MRRKVSRVAKRPALRGPACPGLLSTRQLSETLYEEPGGSHVEDAPAALCRLPRPPDSVSGSDSAPWSGSASASESASAELRLVSTTRSRVERGCRSLFRVDSALACAEGAPQDDPAGRAPKRIASPSCSQKQETTHPVDRHGRHARWNAPASEVRCGTPSLNRTPTLLSASESDSGSGSVSDSGSVVWFWL